MKCTVSFVIALSCCCAQSPQHSESSTQATLATLRTKGNWNGRFWRSMDSKNQVSFLLGFGEAADMLVLVNAGNFENYKKQLPLFWPPLTYEEIQTSLNTFYEIPENRQITIINALNVISNRATGSSEEEVQKQIAKLRATASKER